MHRCPCRDCSRYGFFISLSTVREHCGASTKLQCPCFACHEGDSAGVRPLSTVRDHLLRNGPGPRAVVLQIQQMMLMPNQHFNNAHIPLVLHFDPFCEEEDAAAQELSSTDEDEHEPSDEDEPEAQHTDEYVSSVAAMAEQLVEGIAHKQVTQQGVTMVLKVLHGTVFSHAPGLLVSLIPADARLLMKTAEIAPVEHHYRHFCEGPTQGKSKSLELAKQGDHHLFAVDPADQHFPLCNEDTRYYPGSTKPKQSALLYDLDGCM